VKTTNFGQVVLSEKESFNFLYTNRDHSLSGVFIDNNAVIDQYNTSLSVNADKLPPLQYFHEILESLNDFDNRNQRDWFMPAEYTPQSFDITTHILSLCNTEQEIVRVLDELELFAKRDMIDLLCYIRYLVDVLRKHNIMWGVGRGSSVSSYVLYLLGLHKINSLKYDLDIKEFLK